MTDLPQTDEFIEQKELPTVLNVFTILTYVGSAVFILMAFYQLFMACKGMEMMEGMRDLNDLEALGGMFSNMMNEAMEAAVRQCENKWLVFLLGITCNIATFIGAYLMRKRKQNGLIIYAIPELLLPIASLAIIRPAGFTSIGYYFSIIVAIVFVIVYYLQKQHLTR